MDLCFICGKEEEKEKMFPILFAEDDSNEHWGLGYYCKECDLMIEWLKEDMDI